MSNLTLHYAACHTLDPSKDVPDSQTINELDSLKEYVQILTRNLLESKRLREYHFSSPTLQVRQALESIIVDADRDTSSLAIAQRLLDKEKDTQESIQHLVKLQKGSLLTCYFTLDGINYCLLSKIDHTEFLGLEELQKYVGLPFEKQVLKAALGVITTDEKVEEMILTDSNQKISNFWWNLFLELTEDRDDVENTTTAFNAIDKFLTQKIKRKSKADYFKLWNKLVEYFRGNSTFDGVDIPGYITDNHVKIDDDVDLLTLKAGLSAAISNGKFDSSFNIDLEKIKSRARFKKVIPLSEDIDLHVKPTFSPGNIVKTFDENGEKGIRIITNEGYDYFKD